MGGREPKARPPGPARSARRPRPPRRRPPRSGGRGRGASRPEALEPEPEELDEVDAELEEPDGRPRPRRPWCRAGEAGLTRRDPLQAYMAEVTRHPLLTREEEHALAKQYRRRGMCRRPTGWWPPTCGWW